MDGWLGGAKIEDLVRELGDILIQGIEKKTKKAHRNNVIKGEVRSVDMCQIL